MILLGVATINPKTILLTNNSVDLKAFATIYAYDDPNSDVQERRIALQIKNGNEDFVVSALKPLAMCSEKIPLGVKNGMIRGLKSIPYNIKYVSFIYRWFAWESEETVIFQLLNYFIANCFFNRKDGTFFYALADSLRDESLSQYIFDKIRSNNEYGLKVTKNGENYALELL